VVSKLFYLHVAKETASTIPGKVTAVLAYVTVGVALLSFAWLPFILGAFVASSLYTSVSFFLKVLHILKS
jgi:hypothetical protein